MEQEAGLWGERLCIIQVLIVTSVAMVTIFAALRFRIAGCSTPFQSCVRSNLKRKNVTAAHPLPFLWRICCTMEWNRGKEERWRVNLINLLLIAHCVTLRGDTCFAFAKYILSSTPLLFFNLFTYSRASLWPDFSLPWTSYAFLYGLTVLRCIRVRKWTLMRISFCAPWLLCINYREFSVTSMSTFGKFKLIYSFTYSLFFAFYVKGCAGANKF